MNSLLLAQALAVSTSIAFAVGDITGRLAVRHSTPYTGALLGNLVALLAFFLISLATFSWNAFNLTGGLWFLAAGVFYPGFGFITLYKAFERVGVARTSAMLGMSPLISVAVAVLIMGERPGFFVLSGTALIVLGVIVISLEEDPGGRRMSARDLMWPFLTVLCFGATPVLRKTGLNHLPSPVMGMVLSSLGGLLILLSCAALIPSGQRISRHRVGAFQYILTGFIYALAVYLYFLALASGPISIVVPLVLTYPLFVLIILSTMLRKLERITLRLVAGAVLTVAGAGIITGLG